MKMHTSQILLSQKPANRFCLFKALRKSFVLLVLGFAAFPINGEAQILIKADNADNLNLSSSWTTPPVFDGTEIATWNSTVTGVNSTTVGADLDVAGVNVVNPGGAITIGGANTLTIGGSGISLASATQNLSINAPVVLSAAQTWTVAASRTLALGGGVNIGSNSLTLAGQGTSSNINFNGSLFGSGDLIIAGAGTYAGGGSRVNLLGGTSHTGSTILKSGVLQVSGSNALAGSSQLLLNGGDLAFSVSPATTIASSVAVNAFGGASNTSTIIGGGLGTGDLGILGTTTLRAGTLHVAWAGESTITFNTIARDSVSRGTLAFGIADLPALPNGTTRSVLATNAPTLIGGALGTFAAGVVPWAIAGFGDIMTYDPSGGFRQLTASEYRTSFASAASGDNVHLIGGSSDLSANLTVNSLGVDGGITFTNNPTLTITSGALYAKDNNGIYIPGGGTFDFGSQEGIISGRLALGVKLSGSGGLTFAFGRNISNQVTNLYNTANDFTGGIWVQGGRLNSYDSEVIPDSNSVYLSQAAVLGFNSGGPASKETISSLAGEGTIESSATASFVIGNTIGSPAANSVILNTGGSLNPGNNSGGSDVLPGQLKLATNGGNGTVSLNAGTVNLDLNSATSFDSLAVIASTVSITSANLVLSLAYAPQVGDGFLIMINDGADLITGQFSNGTSITGTFSAQTYYFDILYNTSLFGGTGNDIALVGVVPEPGTILLLSMAGLMAVTLRRRRQPSEG